MAEGTCSQCGAAVLKEQANCPSCGAVLSAADFPIDPEDDFLKQPPPTPAAPPADLPPAPPPAPSASEPMEFSPGEPEAPPSLGEPSDFAPPPAAASPPSGKSSQSQIVIIVAALIVVLLLGVLGVKFLLPMLTKREKPKPAPVVATKPKPANPAPTPKPPEATPPKPAPAAAPAIPNCAKGRSPVEVDKGEIDRAIDAWVEAWNSKNFKAYKSLYAKNFKGIKRTLRPKTYRFNYNGWMRDRKWMLEDAAWTKVEAQNLEITCAAKKEIKVKFTQKYTSDSYNDIGPKTITFARGKKGLKIECEEMVESNPL